MVPCGWSIDTISSKGVNTQRTINATRVHWNTHLMQSFVPKSAERATWHQLVSVPTRCRRRHSSQSPHCTWHAASHARSAYTWTSPPTSSALRYCTSVTTNLSFFFAISNYVSVPVHAFPPVLCVSTFLSSVSTLTCDIDIAILSVRPSVTFLTTGQHQPLK